MCSSLRIKFFATGTSIICYLTHIQRTTHLVHYLFILWRNVAILFIQVNSVSHVRLYHTWASGNLFAMFCIFEINTKLNVVHYLTPATAKSLLAESMTELDLSILVDMFLMPCGSCRTMALRHSDLSPWATSQLSRHTLSRRLRSPPSSHTMKPLAVVPSSTVSDLSSFSCSKASISSLS